MSTAAGATAATGAGAARDASADVSDEMSVWIAGSIADATSFAAPPDKPASTAPRARAWSMSGETATAGSETRCGRSGSARTSGMRSMLGSASSSTGVAFIGVTVVLPSRRAA